MFLLSDCHNAYKEKNRANPHKTISEQIDNSACRTANNGREEQRNKKEEKRHERRERASVAEKAAS